MARRRSNQKRGVAELRSVEGEHILKNQLCGVVVIAVDVALVVEPDHAVALGKQAFGPSSKTTEQVDSERLHFSDCR